MSTTSAIPQGSTVLVTGVNSYLGSHIADQLLIAGYKVRGTARDAAKAKWAQDVFDKKHGTGKFESVIVSNMNAEGAYDEAVKGTALYLRLISDVRSPTHPALGQFRSLGVTGVAHVASNVSFSPDPNVVITETVEGALNALRAAAKEPSVKRVVVTSSTAATPSVELNTPFEITPEMYNDNAIKQAWDGAKDAPAAGTPEAFKSGAIVYSASKTAAERACWKFVEEEKPGFVFNTVLPNMNMGPVLDKAQTSPSAGWLGYIINNSPMAEMFISGIGPRECQNLNPSPFDPVLPVKILRVKMIFAY